jgi:hypothetical protein
MSETPELIDDAHLPIMTLEAHLQAKFINCLIRPRSMSTCAVVVLSHFLLQNRSSRTEIRGVVQISATLLPLLHPISNR